MPMPRRSSTIVATTRPARCCRPSMASCREPLIGREADHCVRPDGVRAARGGGSERLVGYRLSLCPEGLRGGRCAGLPPLDGHSAWLSAIGRGSGQRVLHQDRHQRMGRQQAASWCSIRKAHATTVSRNCRRTLSAFNTNPNGCWNWWGYGNDAQFLTRQGAQINAIWSMVRRLTGQGN